MDDKKLSAHSHAQETFCVPLLHNHQTDASIGSLRRLLSILLLAVFSLSFASPLLALATKSESNVRACCRRNGMHHCLEAASASSETPAFTAPTERCPYLPAAISTIHSDTFSPATNQAIYAELSAHPASAAQTESKFRISRSRSQQKRGPPALHII
jgi:hypothetical protein